MENIKALIAQMTLEEKAGLCSGKDFWRTKAIERLGIPSIMVSDGPHGLRKQKDESDHLGMNESVEAICFPSGATLACSWDKELLNTVGRALGEEAQAEKVAVLLGPAVNIKRSPLCGRNFEYYSEDPLLSTELATAFINGVQSQGVGTSIKHFAVNNQEYKRMNVDAQVDERALREIYLASFEGAIKNAQPWTVMCAYNQVNSSYCSENKLLLSDILKDEWGHEGFVMSDWGAVVDRELGVAAGLELEMPSSNGYGDGRIVDAVNNGTLSMEKLDQTVERLLNIIFKAVNAQKNSTIKDYDKEAHHVLAKAVAAESMVLLKNEASILPLKRETEIGIIGAFAQAPRFQGGGSSHINVTKVDNIVLEIGKVKGQEISYAKGFEINSDLVDERLVEEAVDLAKKVTTVVLFIGLPDRYESEGYDRTHMNIPANQIQLLDAIYQVNQNIVVVLCNGSPIEMPWINQVKGLLDGYLGGQALGGAIAELLFGLVNPSGKLAETFPEKLSHNPSYENFPGENDTVIYHEGIFVGYRYYQKKAIKPLFPFGYGLSYTSFAYESIAIDKDIMKDTDELIVSVTVKNIGAMAGKEVVQLYVADVDSSISKPLQELKAFDKVFLNPGEAKKVTFVLNKRSFAYYSTIIHDWHVESGKYEIRVGGSSEHLPLIATVDVTSTQVIPKVYTRQTIIGDIWNEPIAKPFVDQFTAMFGGNTESLGMDFTEMVKGSVLRTLPMFGLMSQDDLVAFIEKLNAKG